MIVIVIEERRTKHERCSKFVDFLSSEFVVGCEDAYTCFCCAASELGASPE